MESVQKPNIAAKDMKQLAAAILPILQEESASVRAFVELLQDEQHALTIGNTDKLARFAEQKGVLVTRFNSLATDRNTLLTQHGFSSDRLGVESCCAQLPAELGADKLWAKILTHVTKARDLNRLNGELIQMRMQYTNKALDILLQKDRSLDLYGPDGQTTAPGGRRINDAA